MQAVGAEDREFHGHSPLHGKCRSRRFPNHRIGARATFWRVDEQSARERPQVSRRVSSVGDLARGVGRAAAGALLFALPLFMTMEVWQLAVSIPRPRLAVLLGVTIAVTVLLSYHLGFRRRSPRWRDALVDAGVALLVGFGIAALIMWLLHVVEPGQPVANVAATVALAGLPAAIGASFARSQLGDDDEADREEQSYRHELFLMTIGAIVFGANIAPTEEVVLIASMMSELSVLALLAVELAVMHAFVYGVGFRGGSQSPDGFWVAFRQFTLVGYVLAFIVSAFVLWSFGRFDDTAVAVCVIETVVLCLPASVGAAAARLIV